MKQTYYRGHSFPIISLDVNNKRNLVASGERAPNPECHVWDANTGMNIIKFSNVHTKGISVIKFSCSSAYLVTAGQDMMNSIAVHFSPSKNWTDGFFLCSCAIGLSPVRWICFSEVNEYSITVGGMQKISFLRIVQNSLELSAGTFGKSHRQQALLCGVTGHVRDSGGEEIVVTGTTSGYLYIFLKTKVVQKVAAHDRAVCALCRSSNFYISGGKEGFIKVWSIDFELLHSYKVNAFSSRPNSLVCIGLDISLSASSFVVAMKSGELYEISMNSHSVSLLVESHSIGDLSALDYNPVDLLEFATGGDDGFLKIWCLEDFVCTKKLFLEYATRALAYSPDGKRIVVGIGGSMKRTAKDGNFALA